MSIGDMGHADFSPIMKGYTGQGAFRFWCQTVLPLVYDDSLSYYELLNKVVSYLNNTISDVANVEDNVTALASAYDSLQNYVNQYFDSLDVQGEIDRRLDEMAADGTLDNLIAPHLPEIVTAWLRDNITPTTPAVDASLSVTGAAADAKATGTAVNGALTSKPNANSSMDINDVAFAHNGQWYVASGNYPNGSDPDDPHFPFNSSAARIVTIGTNTDSITGKTQFVISSAGKIAYRTGVSNRWNRWRYVINSDQIDSSLSVAGAAADAAETGARLTTVNNKISILENGGLPYRGVINDTNDINDIEFAVGGQWYISTALPTHWPFKNGYGRLITIAGNEEVFSGCRVQFAFSHYIDQFAYRTCVSNSPYWNDWKYVSKNKFMLPNNYSTPLVGKKLCIVGTSFVKQASSSPIPAENQWANMIIADFHMDGYNNGLAGTTVAKIEEDSGNSIWERITKVGGILSDHTNTESDVANGTQYPGKNVDYFIVQGGGNDRSRNVPIGNIDDTTEYTFHGALNLIASAVRAAYPKAKLFYITCFRRWLLDAYPGPNTFGLVDKDYAEAMVANARYNSIRCFDAWHDSGLYPYYGPSSGDDSTYAWPWISRNNKHLNVEGNAFVASIISKWLNNEGV